MRINNLKFKRNVLLNWNENGKDGILTYEKRKAHCNL